MPSMPGTCWTSCSPLAARRTKGGRSRFRPLFPLRLVRRGAGDAGMKLHGKVAVVTGGLRGIGRAIASAMAGEGADILIAGLSMDRAVQAEQEIQALGRRCVVLHVD